MSNVITKMGGITTISAIVTRADGTIEDLGVVASNEKFFKIKRFLWKIKKLFNL